MTFIFNIIKKSHLKKFSGPTTNRLATYQFGKRWCTLYVLLLIKSHTSWIVFFGGGGGEYIPHCSSFTTVRGNVRLVQVELSILYSIYKCISYLTENTWSPLKVKIKLSLWIIKHHAMKLLACGDILPRILNSGTRWRWVVSFTLQSLYSLESPLGIH
jgi:hypothetical protein